MKTGQPYQIGQDVWPGLSKLVEELGELQQVLGKIVETGGDLQHWQGPLEPRLIEELGDVAAAMAFFIGTNHLSTSEIDARTREKLTLFLQWHEERLP